MITKKNVKTRKQISSHQVLLNIHTRTQQDDASNKRGDHQNISIKKNVVEQKIYESVLHCHTDIDKD